MNSASKPQSLTAAQLISKAEAGCIIFWRPSGRFIAKRIRPGYIEVRALVAWNSSTVAVIASY